MLEIPEAKVIAEQINETIVGKVIHEAIANYSPHKFAWYVEEPADYSQKLKGKKILSACSFGGIIEVTLSEEMRLVFGDGVSLRLLTDKEKLPKKHQLLLTFEDGSKIIGSVQMYGGLWCYREGSYENSYHQVARQKPSPLTEQFDNTYFMSILQDDTLQNKSVKALLATEQRIPGLGNGVLQDILFEAGIHPKRKTASLTDDEKAKLFTSLKTTLFDMTFKGGRDTEKDLFGCFGGYHTKLSKKTIKEPCPRCGNEIVKKAYMGGSVYYCSMCQPERP